MTKLASQFARVATTTLGITLLASATPALAAEPANGQNIAGKTVYLAIGAALRSGPNLTDSVVFRADKWTRLTGAEPACTYWNCMVVHSGQTLFARRTRLDLADRSAEADAPPPARPTIAGRPIPAPLLAIPGVGKSREKLVRGDEGEDVRVVQEALSKRGFQLKVDGKYGAGTESAVRRFQRANNLSPDGRVGPLTRERLLKG